jgi:hypothetical protein
MLGLVTLVATLLELHMQIICSPGPKGQLKMMSGLLASEPMAPSPWAVERPSLGLLGHEQVMFGLVTLASILLEM